MTTTAQLADATRKRFRTRLNQLPSGFPSHVVAVVGGGGAYRRLADMLAPSIGRHVTVECTHYMRMRTYEAVRPRFVIIAPAGKALPLAKDLRRLGATVVDLLDGLRSRDREAFLRFALRELGR